MLLSKVVKEYESRFGKPPVEAGTTQPDTRS